MNNRQYLKDPMEIERLLVDRIEETGKQQMKSRKKAGLSSFYIKNGKIIEKLPNNTEQIKESVKSKWISVDKSKRAIRLK